MATFEGRFTDVQGLRIAVVIARFNDLVTSKLLSGCLDCLSRHGIDTGADSTLPAPSIQTSNAACRLKANLRLLGRN